MLAKLRALMNHQTAAKLEPDLEALIEAEGLAMRPRPKLKVDREILKSLREAIITRRNPYGFLYGKRQYLIAWSELDGAKDFRSFVLSNVEKVELLDQTFAHKRGFLIKKYAENSFGVFQEKPIDVVWRFTPKAAPNASEFLFHPNQVIEPQKDGSLVVRFHAGGLLEMSWHLFTWGEEVEVIKPKHLASMLHEQCRSRREVFRRASKELIRD